MREFGRGVRMLLAGFGWWRRDPGAMAVGMLPGIITALAFGGALVGLGLGLAPLTEAATPFAESWPDLWRTAARVALGTAVLGGALVVAVVSFTAVTLVIGEPCYDRVWRAVERRTTGEVPDAGYGLASAAADSARLVAKGLGVAVLAFALGFVPIVGGVLAGITGFVLTAGLVADELASRALTARGLDRRRRRTLLGSRRARVLGFGAATQLCFLVPLGAVLVMPAAVAGSTLLALSLLDDAAPEPSSQPR